MKRIIALFLSVVMLLGTVVFAVHADSSDEAEQPVLGEINPDEIDDSALKAGEIAMQALKLLSDDKVTSIFKTIFTGVGYFNSALTFLKLIGVMEDSTGEALAKIQETLDKINSKVDAIDTKLNGLIDSMSKMQATTEFIARTTNAKDYRYYYKNNFYDGYRKALVDLIDVDFETMRTNAIKAWYQAGKHEQRVSTTLDNSNVILIYDQDETGKYVLRYTTQNRIPSGYTERCVYLSNDFLPLVSDLPQWNIDTYQDNVKHFIEEKIKANFNGVAFQNYPEFAARDEQAIKAVAVDAVNLITYRAIANEINKDSHFANAVLNAFNNYAKDLLKPEAGFDALVRALYYTHAFEFEIQEPVEELYNSMVVEVAYFGSFVLDVIGMSNDIARERKNDFYQTYCNTLVSLRDKKDASFTGHPNFCYLTNTLLEYGTVTMNTSAQIKITRDIGQDGYSSFSANSFTTSASPYDLKQMIGTDAANLLMLTLRANGVTAGHDYFMNSGYGFSQSQLQEDCGAILVSVQGESDLPQDSSVTLTANPVTGSWFNGTVQLSSLPGRAESKYIVYHRQVQGTVANFAAGTVTNNATVAALAIYGESHSYWWDDESAFLSGPNSAAKITRNVKETCTRTQGRQKFDEDFTMSVKYNCLVSVPLVPSLFTDPDQENPSPLTSYISESNAIAEAERTPDQPAPVEEQEPVRASEDQEKNGKTLLVLYVVVPVAVVLAAGGLTTFFVIRARRKKKKAE